MSATSDRPRELNRSNSEDANTGTGTPSSIAALDGPASLTGVRDVAGEAVESGIGGEGLGRQVEQPAGDDTAAAPDLGDRRQVEVEAVVLRLRQRSCLGVLDVVFGADVGLGEDVEPFGVGSHQPVLDAVVDHLDEVSCTAVAAVQPTVLDVRRHLAGGGAGGRALGAVDSRGEGVEDRREPFDGRCRPADHQAVATLETVHPAAHADVDVVDASLGQRSGSIDVVAVPRVATVDDRVTALEQGSQLVDGLTDEGRRDHHPHVARRGEGPDELLERRGSGHSVVRHRRHRLGPDVVADALVAGAHQAEHHVRSHPAEPDHAHLHAARLPRLAADGDVT